MKKSCKFTRPRTATDSFMGKQMDLSGLIIDKFADVFVVIEPYSAGYIETVDWLASSLQSLYPGSRIAVRPDERTALKEGVDFSKIAKIIPAPIPWKLKKIF